MLSDLEDSSLNEEDLVNESEMSQELDASPKRFVKFLDFKQENLYKKIPHLTILRLIADAYPGLVTETNEITMENLAEIIKEGANANCFECLSDESINKENRSSLGTSDKGIMMKLASALVRTTLVSEENLPNFDRTFNSFFGKS